jgi:hypothetical protein
MQIEITQARIELWADKICAAAKGVIEAEVAQLYDKELIREVQSRHSISLPIIVQYLSRTRLHRYTDESGSYVEMPSSFLAEAFGLTELELMKLIQGPDGVRIELLPMAGEDTNVRFRGPFEHWRALDE